MVKDNFDVLGYKDSLRSFYPTGIILNICIGIATTVLRM